MPSLGAGSCQTCGATTSTRCSACSEGVDIEGNASPTYYCSAACQKTSYKKHKAACRDSNIRKQLYRGAQFVQDVFYAFREMTFTFKITKIEKAVDTLHMYQTRTGNADIPIFPFPDHLVPETRDKQALLAYLRCTESLSSLTGLVRKALKGICDWERSWEVAFRINKNPRFVRHYLTGVFNMVEPHTVVPLELGDGNIFVLDLTGAQYGQHRAVVPCSPYMSAHGGELLAASEFGHIEQMYDGALTGKRCEELHKQFDMRVWVYQKEIAKTAIGTVCGWEHRNKTSLSDMLNSKQAVFEVESKELLELIKQNMKVHSTWFDDPKGPRVYSKVLPGQGGSKLPEKSFHMSDSQDTPSEAAEMFATLKID